MRIEYKGENFSGALAAAVDSTVELVHMLIPAKSRVRLKEIGNYQSEVANWGKIRWDFYINGVLLYSFNAIRDQIGYAAARQRISETLIYGGSLLQVIAVQESGGADNVGISLGWEIEHGA